MWESTYDLFFEGSRLKFQLTTCAHFPQSLQANAGKSMYDCFLPLPLQFIIKLVVSFDIKQCKTAVLNRTQIDKQINIFLLLSSYSIKTDHQTLPYYSLKFERTLSSIHKQVSSHIMELKTPLTGQLQNHVCCVSARELTDDYQMYVLKVQNLLVYRPMFLYLQEMKPFK
jgi:hypothetical protein